MRQLADHIRIAGTACFLTLCSAAGMPPVWNSDPGCAFTVQRWPVGVSSIKCEESCSVSGTHLCLNIYKRSLTKNLCEKTYHHPGMSYVAPHSEYSQCHTSMHTCTHTYPPNYQRTHIQSHQVPFTYIKAFTCSKSLYFAVMFVSSFQRGLTYFLFFVPKVHPTLRSVTTGGPYLTERAVGRFS